MSARRNQRSDSTDKHSNADNCQKSNSNTQRGASNSKKQRKPKRGKSRELEVNVPDSDVNRADLAGFTKVSRDNDIAWYSRNPELLRDSASYPFSMPLGTYAVPLTTGTLQGVTLPTFAAPMAKFPGIMTINWSPTIGVSTDTTSAVNLASRNIYSFVRHANSGHANYDSPDLMMYLIAVDSAFSFYANMIRAYGVAMTYAPMNRYVPKALMDAMGFKYDTLQSELANFRYYINLYAAKLASLCVPADMAYIQRHIWMNTGVYYDAETMKAQQYLFVQKSCYTFVEATEGPGYLEWTDIPYSTFGTVASIQSFGDSLIEPLLASEDIGIMSGDILKAFGRENLLFVTPIDEAYATIPSYSKEVLSQIENLTVVGSVLPTGSPLGGSNYTRNIIQVTSGDLTGSIYQKLVYGSADIKTAAAAYPYVRLSFAQTVNMHWDKPTGADVMIATRLTNAAAVTAVDSTNGLSYEFKQTGSEVVTAITMYTLQWSTGQLVPARIDTPMLNLTDADKIVELAQFDWAPAIWLYQGGPFSILGQSLDIENYTQLTPTDLRALHDTALLSMFDVPKMAALSRIPVASK